MLLVKTNVSTRGTPLHILEAGKCSYVVADAITYIYIYTLV